MTRVRLLSKQGARVLLTTWLVLLALTVGLAVPVYAAGGISAKDLYTCTFIGDGEEEITSTAVDLPDYATIKDIAAKEPADTKDLSPILYQRYLKACEIASTFGTTAEYDKATAKLKGIVVYDGTKDALVPTNTSAKGEQDLSRGVDKFNSTVGSIISNNQINGIFDTGSFNPSAGAAAPFLDTFYMAVNTIFYVVSNVVIWWFLAQTSFDMLYMVCEPIRPLIGPGNANGQPGSQNAIGGGQGWQQAVNKIANVLHVCSSEVAEACNGGSVGGFGSQNAASGNKWMIYARKRFPVVLFLAVYLILVSSGWWPRIISWVAGGVTSILGMFVK